MALPSGDAREYVEFAEEMTPIARHMISNAAGDIVPRADYALRLAASHSAKDLQQWRFVLLVHRYVLGTGAAKLSDLYRLNRKHPARILDELDREASRCYPFRQRATSDLHSLVRDGVLPVATPAWVLKHVPNYTMLALLGDQLFTYVFMARAQDTTVPAAMREPRAAQLLALSLALIAVRHTPVMRALGAGCRGEEEFVDVAHIADVAAWPLRHVDALRLRGAHMVLSLRSVAGLEKFASMGNASMPVDAAGRPRDDVRPPMLRTGVDTAGGGQ